MRKLGRSLMTSLRAPQVSKVRKYGVIKKDYKYRLISIVKSLFIFGLL